MNMSEQTSDRSIPGRDYPPSAAGEASRMTAPARVTPNNVRDATPMARAARDVRQAWAAAPPTLRALTLGAAIAALSSSLSADVPVASALAIALMTAAALVDWHQRRLPDAIVLAAGTVFVLTSLAEIAAGAAVALVGVGLGLVVFAGPLLVLHLAAPRAMGFGDVKAAAVLGMAIGGVAWGLAAWALMAAAASTALAGIALRRSTLPLGPGLVAAVLSGVVAVAVFGLDGIGL